MTTEEIKARIEAMYNDGTDVPVGAGTPRSRRRGSRQELGGENM